MDRKQELSERLSVVRERISTACAAAGRSPETVRLVVVTKYFPASDVDLLAQLGVHDVAENKAQELTAKVQQVTSSSTHWHFVGQLQSNKAKLAASACTVVHSLDRPSVVRALGRAAADRETPLRCLIQVNLDEAARRGGCLASEVPELAQQVVQWPGLVVAGVMAVAPKDSEPERWFAQLAKVSEQLRSDFPTAVEISAGMSGDFEKAIQHGATLIRVGAAVLGSRPRVG